MRGSIWDKINADEVEAKLVRLVLRLRGPRDEHITEFVMRYTSRMLTRSRRDTFFAGGFRGSEGEIYWFGRLEAEVRFLNDYLYEVARTYLGLAPFKQHHPLSSEELIELWEAGIKPQWDSFVYLFKANLESVSDEGNPDLEKRLNVAYDRQADQILRAVYRDWQVIVEEAKSAEKFTRLNSGTAGVENSAGRRKAANRHLNVPPGASWQDVRITMVEHNLHVEVGGVTADVTFRDAGFEERRRGGLPDRLWAVLRAFAMHGGVLPFDDPGLSAKQRQSLKQYVSRLRKRLRALLPIQADPFKPARGAREYRSRFTISTSEGLQFPAPADATWDKVSISEVKMHVVRFSVKSRAVFGAYERNPDREPRPEAAVDERTIQEDYGLRLLGLTEQDGSPDSMGRALIDVVRGGGRITRGADDESMLKLCQFLSTFMKINDAPFSFSQNNRQWSAAFDAFSDVPPKSR